VNSLAPRQHFDKLANLPRPRFSFLHCLNTKQYRVAVRAVQICEKSLCRRVRIQRGLKIWWDRRPFGRIISSVPSAIFLRRFDRCQSCRLHPSISDQCRCFFAIDFRPDAFLRSRQKTLQPCFVAFAELLPIDPSVAESSLQRLSIGDRLQLRIFFRQPQPQSLRLTMIFLKPRSPMPGSMEQKNRIAGIRCLLQDPLSDVRPYIYWSLRSARRRCTNRCGRYDDINKTGRHVIDEA
jgi:hypothetical protein